MLGVREFKEYKAVVKEFSNEKGKFQYDRFSKELVQIAASNKVVAKKVENREECAEIALYVLNTLVCRYSKDYKGTEEIGLALYYAFDTITGRGAFGDLRKYIRGLLKAQKRVRPSEK